MVLTDDLLEDRLIGDVTIKSFFPLFFKRAESFETLESILPDLANEDVEKNLVEAVDRCVKHEEERKTRFFVENEGTVSVERD